MEWLGYLAAIMLVVAGMAGTFLPALPGLPLVLAGFFLAAWMDGFVHVGAPILIALAVLSINFVGDGLRDALDPKIDRQ